ncbi:hypothetical protein FA13DRAFT_1715427 [Coprinellus micaceus]|uniref:Uncharacterized protein n=1 Tax=Coprinellus micaceus TaxID=71717 RepID=A0A4Y7SNB3_COPMI|nr:hypothetical protein FA13DRAFT_1715427 [Coprinellus micaceus]
MIRHRQRPKEARRQREYSVFVAVWLCSWCEGIDNEDGGMKYGWLCVRSYGEVGGQVYHGFLVVREGGVMECKYDPLIPPPPNIESLGVVPAPHPSSVRFRVIIVPGSAYEERCRPESIQAVRLIRETLRERSVIENAISSNLEKVAESKPGQTTRLKAKRWVHVVERFYDPSERIHYPL